MLLAFFAGVGYVWYRCRAENLKFDQMLNVAYIFIFVGVIGSRLAYVLLHLSDFADDPLSAINPFHGDRFGIAGLNLYGGVVLSVIAALVYLRVRKLTLLAVFDLFAPTVGIGLFLARIGCFLNGCCFGTPTDAPWAVTFPEGSIPDAVFGQQAIHPAQLYSSLYGLILFLILHFMIRRKKFDGQVTAVYFMLEAFFRYIIEYVRYYETEMHVHLLGMEPTFNQLVSITLFATGVLMYIFLPRILYRAKARA